MSYSTVMGLWSGGRGERDDMPDRLPLHWAKDRIGKLIGRANPMGLYVTSAGAEKFTISDGRGRILLKDAGFIEADDFIRNYVGR